MAGCREGSCFAFFRFEVTFAAVFPPTIDPFFPTFCSKNYFCIIMVGSYY